MIVPDSSISAHRNPSYSSGNLVTWFALLVFILTTLAIANIVRADTRTDSLDDPEEPSNLLQRIDERRTQKDSLFSVSPMRWLHNSTDQSKQNLYDSTGLKLGLNITHVFQGLSEALPGEDRGGSATTTNIVGTWDMIDKGQPTLGQGVFHVQGRWDYGTTGPGDLGGASLGSLIGTANTFSKYQPAFLLRNLYWRQGSPEAGWAYRFGKITPDSLLSTSSHISSSTTFLPNASTGPFAIALPDSGLGAVGALYLNDRVTLVGLVSDANADRYNFGDIGEGDLFTAVELHVKVAPRTPKAGYSKLTLWHTDGTKDGLPINGMAGPSGWGGFVKLEQELTANGKAVGILRYGKSFNSSALYQELATVHFLLYDPTRLGKLKNDLLGVAYTWVKATAEGARDEYNVELFYRFPLFTGLDTTLSYQSVFNPAMTREIDHASVFSLRIRAVF